MDLFAICFGDEHDCELLAYFGESLMSMLEVVIIFLSLRGLENVLIHNWHSSRIDSRKISHDHHLYQALLSFQA